MCMNDDLDIINEIASNLGITVNTQLANLHYQKLKEIFSEVKNY